MKNCDSIRPLLALSAGKDLDPRDGPPVADHLRLCRVCREEESQFMAMIVSARKTYTNRYELSAIDRNRIAIAAAEKARRNAWTRIFPILVPARGAALLVAAAAVLVALVALPIVNRDGGGGTAHDPLATMTIEVRTVEPGIVRLAWSNGARDGYTVYKSHDPRLLTHAEAHEVDGTIWTDTDSESAPIVYYRIE